MGSSTSRPAPEATAYSHTPSQAALYEKQSLAAGRVSTATATATATATSSQHHIPSTPNHHAADRLERIAAESAGASASASSKGHRSVRIGGSSGGGGGALDDDDVSARPASAPVKLSEIKKWQDKVERDPVSRLAQLTLHNASAKDSLHRRKAEVADTHVFNTAIDHESNPITNQMSSGRCWLFATTNVIRNEMVTSLNIDGFQLSQSYLHFWDKLEKANYFLENTLELWDQALDSRVFGFLKTEPVNDGGQFSMAANLLVKYGVVPQSVYPESFNTSATSTINAIVTRRLREDALVLRELKSSTIAKLRAAVGPAALSDEAVAARADEVCRRRKDAMMEEIYRVMVIMDGEPPKPDEAFTYEYRDRKGAFRSVTMTPTAFLRAHAPNFAPAEQVSLVHDPRRPADVLMTVSRLGNVWGGGGGGPAPVQPVLYVNTTPGEMKRAAIATIRAGLPVWFGCDVGQCSDSRRGVMDTALFDYEAALGFDFGMTKAQRIDLGESSMTHAMVLTAVHLDAKGHPVRWRVENSWGAAPGDKGYFVMSDTWFDEYVFQVVIRKAFVSKQSWKLFQQGINDETHVLPPYDPFGALA